MLFHGFLLGLSFVTVAFAQSLTLPKNSPGQNESELKCFEQEK